MSQNSTVNIGHADSQPLTGQLGPLTRWNLLGFQCHLRYSCKLLPTLGRCCCKLAANAGNCGVSAAGKPPGHLSKFTDAFPFSSRPKSAKALARPIKAQKFCSKPVLACSLIQKPCRCLFTNSLGLTQRDNATREFRTLNRWRLDDDIWIASPIQRNPPPLKVLPAHRGHSSNPSAQSRRHHHESQSLERWPAREMHVLLLLGIRRILWN